MVGEVGAAVEEEEVEDALVTGTDVVGLGVGVGAGQGTNTRRRGKARQNTKNQRKAGLSHFKQVLLLRQ